jgi:hypothetical protein
MRYSIITIIWWLGMWGLIDTILTHFYKENILYKLFFYLSLIILVVILTKIDPTIVEYL